MSNMYDRRHGDHYKIEWTQEKRDAVIAAVDEYLRCYGRGEGIMQVDDAQTDGLELLCEIADKIACAEYIEEIEEGE
jgi:hypothetical protein